MTWTWCLTVVLSIVVCCPIAVPYWFLKVCWWIAKCIRCRFVLMVSLLTTTLKMGKCLSVPKKKHEKPSKVKDETPGKYSTNTSHSQTSLVTRQTTSSKPYRNSGSLTKPFSSNLQKQQVSSPLRDTQPSQFPKHSVENETRLKTESKPKSLKSQAIPTTHQKYSQPLSLQGNTQSSGCTYFTSHQEGCLKTQTACVSPYQDYCLAPPHEPTNEHQSKATTHSRSANIRLEPEQRAKELSYTTNGTTTEKSGILKTQLDFHQNNSLKSLPSPQSEDRDYRTNQPPTGKLESLQTKSNFDGNRRLSYLQNHDHNSLILSKFADACESEPIKSPGDAWEAEQSSPGASLVLKELEEMKRSRKQPKPESGGSSKKQRVFQPQDDTSKTVITELQTKLMKRYLAESVESHGDIWFDIRTLKDNRVTSETVKLPGLIPLEGSEANLLVFGKPRFGKTALCQTLSYMWASQLADKSEEQRKPANHSGIHRFKLCFQYQLTKEKVHNIEENLLDRCCRVLEHKIKKDTVRNAWQMCMGQTILLLDGYHNLDQQGRSLVKAFLQRNSFFRDASVLLTSRPDVDPELAGLFTRHADICGLSRELLLKEVVKKSDSSIGQKLDKFITSCKVEELYGISPRFYHLVAKAFIDDNRPGSLYELLDFMLHHVVEKELGQNNLDSPFRQIGMVLFDKLKTRQYIFKKNLLEQYLDIVDSLDILVPVNSSDVVVLHRAFMLYFSVKYLQHEWKRLTLSKQKNTFLNRQFSFPSCSLECILDSKDASKAYYAGVVPDIVLQVTDQNFSSSSFKLTQDIDCPGIETAFSTGNLLLRLDQKFLKLFGIEVISDDDLQNEYADVMELFEFPNLIVLSTFYRSASSPLLQTKFTAVNEEKNQTVLFGTASVNTSIPHGKEGHYREIYIDFKVSELNDLSTFLSGFTETFLEIRHLKDAYTAEQGSELVYDLVSAALQAPKDRSIEVTLGSNAVHNISSLITFEILPPKAKVRCLSWSQKNKEHEVDFDLTTISKWKDQLMGQLNVRSNDLPGLCVTVRVKAR